VLESLAEGVPMVALPLGNDQPGVAARVKACGAGVVVSRRRGNFKQRLRAGVRAVLEDGRYREAARRVQTEMAKVDGLEKAADVIERALGI